MQSNTKHQYRQMHTSFFVILVPVHANTAIGCQIRRPLLRCQHPLLPLCPRGILASQAIHICSHRIIHVCSSRINNILLLVVRQFLSALWQPRPAFSSEIFKCRFCKMKLDDDVNKSILAAAVCRFHMKCVMPLRRATTRCPHSSLFGRQNCCQWLWFSLMTGREGWEKILPYAIFNCAPMSKNTMSSISLNWKNCGQGKCYFI